MSRAPSALRERISRLMEVPLDNRSRLLLRMSSTNALQAARSGDSSARSEASIGRDASIRYLGAKTRVAGAILDIVGRPRRGSVFIDAFAGTGAVARAAALRGWDVRINDHLYCASRMALASVLSGAHARFASVGGYSGAIEQLNNSAALRGFIWREYSPASYAHTGAERRYFTEMNAARIDGMRARIREWSAAGALAEHEEALLVADLLVASSRVANTAGTFGCFMRRWQQNAISPIALETRCLLPATVGVEALTGEVSEVPATSADVAYFDPPYTKRQYAAYYHILETIAHGDTPSVGGVTGLRPWRHRTSAFCYRRRALRAIVDTLVGTRAGRVFLSYSSEGHVQLDQLEEELSKHGRTVVHTLGSISRYAPNENARDNGTSVTEYLVEFSRYAKRST